MSTTNDNMNKILDKVRKMMAIANDAAASQGERDNAMRMSHALLAKHNLSMSEAEARGDTSQSEKRMDGSIETKAYPWMRRCAHGIAELFFCKYFFMKTKNGNAVKHYFIGKESNVITAQEISAFVTDSILREAKRQSKDQFNPTVWGLNFMKGAADTIWYRCIQLRRDAEKVDAPVAGSTGTALVLANVYALEQKANSAYLQDVLNIKLKSSVGREKRAGDGAGAGAAFGKSIPLNRQIGGASSSTKRLA